MMQETPNGGNITHVFDIVHCSLHNNLRKYGSIVYAYNNTAMEAGHEQDCGKGTLNAIRSDILKARRDKNKAMRANGINVVDRHIRVGKRDEKGRLRYIEQHLEIGVRLPKKEKRFLLQK